MRTQRSDFNEAAVLIIAFLFLFIGLAFGLALATLGKIGCSP